jgi:hypothetical protein
LKKSAATNQLTRTCGRRFVSAVQAQGVDAFCGTGLYFKQAMQLASRIGSKANHRLIRSVQKASRTLATLHRTKLLPALSGRSRALPQVAVSSSQKSALGEIKAQASSTTQKSTPNAVEVVQPGLLTLVQDLGRDGLWRVGVPPSGPMDHFGNLSIDCSELS